MESTFVLKRSVSWLKSILASNVHVNEESEHWKSIAKVIVSLRRIGMVRGWPNCYQETMRSQSLGWISDDSPPAMLPSFEV
jgi:hypothetical protein